MTDGVESGWRGRWLLPNLAFALSQHRRVGADSPAHLLPHELVREILRRGAADELTHQAKVVCIGGVTDPTVQRGYLDSVEGLLLAFTGAGLARCRCARGTFFARAAARGAGHVEALSGASERVPAGGAERARGGAARARFAADASDAEVAFGTGIAATRAELKW